MNAYPFRRFFPLYNSSLLAPFLMLLATRQALHHLARSGWLVQLRKGLYAVLATVPGASPAHEFEVAMALVHPAAISHFSAMHFHELTDQIPQRVFITTTTGRWVPRANEDRGGYPSERDNALRN